MAKKVYAIQYGFDAKNNKKIENIIVNTWDECLKYVKGVKGAKYKSFESIDDAKLYLNEGNRMLKKSDENYPKDCLHAYVDGSYNSSDGRYSYGIVCVNNDVVEYIESNAENDTSERNIRQIAGELKGAVRAVEYALSQGQTKIVLFHDYEGIAHHATGAWERKEESSVGYYEKMQTLMKSGIDIIFVKVDSHTGDLFNELVDEKCKECLGITSDRVVEKWLKKNTIKVSNANAKTEILSLAPNCTDNIILIGNNEDSDLNQDISVQKNNEELDREIKFNQIIDLYKNNCKDGKKAISKLLSKEKEALILYLLNNYN
ncbi:ribonuclease HI [Clostridium saccharoperbutylacetonicum]|uniref:Putative double-stranded RNA/RNA-DNA hybrid binding protein n=1 Tax=Clostridium saccharoperbutylacetonicum N1-4(HMT) TaxID=931276 RepID=M1LZX2_9CLOT|nr:ribonuclease H family protein [Clostridium saccharoperbutylacetonicum]AGF58845.1 putative double-stranded RNA/RNA-DNA hybrid binding protein [Clostridium saccharoperbutylacetonicum N1-4(HMT)]NRT60371.1 ribonuclease HI [Clostridium saccharoperbutylacetonicum]NSB23684.1 ribonuclease HI [Clostridium saccharoperbutylacetonicum]NSB43055.1 ribonuclease HI [Clostridium saccharoperbutylacetonicum]